MTSAPKPTASRVLPMALGGMVVIVADGVAAAVLAALTYLISPSIITTTRGFTVGCLEVTLVSGIRTLRAKYTTEHPWMVGR